MRLPRRSGQSGRSLRHGADQRAASQRLGEDRAAKSRRTRRQLRQPRLVEDVGRSAATWSPRANTRRQSPRHLGALVSQRRAKPTCSPSCPISNSPARSISQATFKNGQLDGAWTIYDGKMRKISQWEFADGKRHGPSTWWYANGKKMREIAVRDGDIDGALPRMEPATATLPVKDTYKAGRKLGRRPPLIPAAPKEVGRHVPVRQGRRSKRPTIGGTASCRPRSRPASDEKHGPWTSWHPNGQRQLEGTYEHDVQVGKFTWWHANGQKALEGRFIARQAGRRAGPGGTPPARSRSTANTPTAIRPVAGPGGRKTARWPNRPTCRTPKAS